MMDSSDGSKWRSKSYATNALLGPGIYGPPFFLVRSYGSKFSLVLIRSGTGIFNPVVFLYADPWLGRCWNQVSLRTLNNLILAKLSLSFKFSFFLFFDVPINLEVLVFEPYQDILSSFLSIWQYLIISFD